jgi:hypothetical protein
VGAIFAYLNKLRAIIKTPPSLGEIMQAFELTQLIDQRSKSGKLYLEFLRVPDLSMGLY